MNERISQLKSLNGLTLVEILIFMIIFSLIIGVMYTQFFMGWNMWDLINGQLEIQQDSMVSLKWIRDDIRTAGPASILDLPADGQWYSSMTFLKAKDVVNNNVVWSENIIQYTLDASSGKILRNIGGKSFSIARNVNLLRFRRLSDEPGMVEIEIGFGKETLKVSLDNRHVMKTKLRN